MNASIKQVHIRTLENANTNLKCLQAEWNSEVYNLQKIQRNVHFLCSFVCFVVIPECPVPPRWHSSETAWNYTEGLQKGNLWGARCHQCRSPWIGHPWSWPGDSVLPTSGMICYMQQWPWLGICKLNSLYPSYLCLTQGCRVLHPPVRTHRSSRQDGSLYLLLPEERGGPVALRGKQSSMLWRATLNWTTFLVINIVLAFKF